jgi:hypothetical protein
VSEQQLAAIERWRRVIIGVAAQEMLHLTLASNLLSALGIDETEEQRSTLADVAVGVMFELISPVGQYLTELPAGPEYPGRTAGPSFELFYTSDYLLPHRRAAWLLLEERLREAASFARRLEPADTLTRVALACDRFAEQLRAHSAGM